MQQKRNVMLDFTHTYDKQMAEHAEYMDYLDCSDISGTDMYCTPEAELELTNRIKPYSVSGIHFLDSGNYHYVSKIFIQKIQEPFTLVVFDFHNDMQIPMIHDLTSCGGWVRQVLMENTYLHQLVIIGPDQKTIDEISIHKKRKLICISLQELEEHKAKVKLKDIDEHIPIYVSIDKDVLSKSYARTNWNQGQLSIVMLEQLLKAILIHREVIGADICGELPMNSSIPDFIEGERINRKTDHELYQFLSHYLNIE